MILSIVRTKPSLCARAYIVTSLILYKYKTFIFRLWFFFFIKRLTIYCDHFLFRVKVVNNYVPTAEKKALSKNLREKLMWAIFSKCLLPSTRIIKNAKQEKQTKNYFSAIIIYRPFTHANFFEEGKNNYIYTHIYSRGR